MNVYQIRLLLIQQSGKLLSCVRSPNSFSDQLKLPETRIGSDFPVAPAIRSHGMSGAFQHLTLLFKNNVFTARLLVRVMYEQNLHLQPDPFRRAS